MKGVLRRIGDRNFEEDILAVNERLRRTNGQLVEQEEKCERIKEEIQK